MKRKSGRRGAVVPLMAILMTVLVAMVAFSVDIGYIAVSRGELQNAVDAAALAGAMRLQDSRVQWWGVGLTGGLPTRDAIRDTAVANAKAEARTFAQYNRVGGTSLMISDADIVVGFLATPYDQNPLQPTPPDANYPNTVQVTAIRNNLNLFFGPAIGTSSVTVQGTGTATLTRSPWQSGGVLPIALDVNFWNSLVDTGRRDALTPMQDAFTVTAPTGVVVPPMNVTSGPDNIPELPAYPTQTSPGNFGLLNLGAPNMGTPNLRRWIADGPSAAELATFGPNGLQASWNQPTSIGGNPGLRSTLVGDLAATRGQQRLIPLFRSFTGQGANTVYDIVGFASITIVEAVGSGSNISVTLQPALGSNPVHVDATTPMSQIPQPGAGSPPPLRSPLQLTR